MIRGVLCGYRGDGDHPRICGEHVCHASSYLSVMGSSPHMRGTPPACPDQGARRRIIPAYAGNTRCRALLSARAWDHPRICGEHLKLGQRAKIGWGSSPHMRGTRSRSRTRRNEGGIIPAYAGNTLFESISADPSRDHPRICGEHRPAGLIRDGQQGSSPHMRG